MTCGRIAVLPFSKAGNEAAMLYVWHVCRSVLVYLVTEFLLSACGGQGSSVQAQPLPRSLYRGNIVALLMVYKCIVKLYKICMNSK